MCKTRRIVRWGTRRALGAIGRLAGVGATAFRTAGPIIYTGRGRRLPPMSTTLRRPSVAALSTRTPAMFLRRPTSAPETKSWLKHKSVIFFSIKRKSILEINFIIFQFKKNDLVFNLIQLIWFTGPHLINLCRIIHDGKCCRCNK